VWGPGFPPHGKDHFRGSYLEMSRLACGRYFQPYSLGGRSHAASGYQSSAAACCQCWCRDTLSNSDRRKPPLLPQTLPNCARMFVALITSLGRPVRAPGRNAPLIRFLISALYVLLARLMFILCASPPLVFYIYFVL